MMDRGMVNRWLIEDGSVHRGVVEGSGMVHGGRIPNGSMYGNMLQSGRVVDRWLPFMHGGMHRNVVESRGGMVNRRLMLRRLVMDWRGLML